jgi:hypothetical protein
MISTPKVIQEPRYLSSSRILTSKKKDREGEEQRPLPFNAL